MTLVGRVTQIRDGGASVANTLVRPALLQPPWRARQPNAFASPPAKGSHSRPDIDCAVRVVADITDCTSSCQLTAGSSPTDKKQPQPSRRPEHCRKLRQFQRKMPHDTPSILHRRLSRKLELSRTRA